ncbi:MAG: hypothetical protein ACUZ8H_14700 [Candidatus Anammoxibacter sp.]
MITFPAPIKQALRFIERRNSMPAQKRRRRSVSKRIVANPVRTDQPRPADTQPEQPVKSTQSAVKRPVVTVKPRAGNPLKTIISLAKKFTGANKSSKAILQYIKLEIKGNKLHVSATNLERWLYAQTGPSDSLQFSSTGAASILVDVRKLSDVLRKTTKQVSLQIIRNTHGLSLRINNLKIKGKDTDDFPVIPRYRSGNSFMIPDINNKINFVSKAAWKGHEPNNTLSNLLLDFANNKLIATNTQRMHITPITTDFKRDKTLIPARIAGIAKILNGNVAMFFNAKNGDRIEFGVNLRGWEKCVAGYMGGACKYPDYTHIIPKDPDSIFTAKKEDLLPVLDEACMAINKDRCPRVECEIILDRLILNPPGLRIIKGDWQLTPEGIKALKFNGGAKDMFRCSINLYHVADAIRHIPGDTIKIHLPVLPEKPWTITGVNEYKDYSAIIMPFPVGE